jgi:hypothetical protein
MSSDDESGIEQQSSSSSSLPNKERHIERIVNSRGIRTFLIIDHTANLRKNSKVSAIWDHGGERRRLDDDSMARYWRYIYCTGSATLLKVNRNSGQTTYALRHLKNKHNVDCQADDQAISSRIVTFAVTASAGSSAIVTIAIKAVREAYKLITIYDAVKFR